MALCFSLGILMVYECLHRFQQLLLALWSYGTEDTSVILYSWEIIDQRSCQSNRKYIYSQGSTTPFPLLFSITSAVLSARAYNIIANCPQICVNWQHRRIDRPQISSLINHITCRSRKNASVDAGWLFEIQVFLSHRSHCSSVAVWGKMERPGAVPTSTKTSSGSVIYLLRMKRATTIWTVWSNLGSGWQPRLGRRNWCE